MQLATISLQSASWKEMGAPQFVAWPIVQIPNITGEKPLTALGKANEFRLERVTLFFMTVFL